MSRISVPCRAFKLAKFSHLQVQGGKKPSLDSMSAGSLNAAVAISVHLHPLHCNTALTLKEKQLPLKMKKHIYEENTNRGSRPQDFGVSNTRPCLQHLIILLNLTLIQLFKEKRSLSVALIHHQPSTSSFSSFLLYYT